MELKILLRYPMKKLFWRPFMKLLLIGLFISFNALAEVTPAQMAAIRTETNNIMFEVGADERLNPRVTRVSVKDLLGDRVKVKFTFVEDLYGSKTCSYYYDLSVMKSVPRSALCGL